MRDAVGVEVTNTVLQSLLLLEGGGRGRGGESDNSGELHFDGWFVLKNLKSFGEFG